MTRPKVLETLQGFMLAVPVTVRDDGQPGRWQSRFDGIPRMAASAVLKYGPKADDEQPAVDDDGQPADHGGNGLDQELAKLARLGAAAYDKVRRAKAKQFGIRTDTLDKLVAKLRGAAAEDAPAPGQGRALEWSDPKPWPEPVNGADLLDELAATFKKYVVLPAGGDTVLSLWTLHTHTFQSSPITPRLQIKSPEPRCGKSRVMDILEAASHRPLKVENITAAAIFRTVEMVRPTLLLDEADTFISTSEELRGILNSGHSCGGAVIRTVGDDFEPRLFSTWAPVAIAAIGKIPRTLEDRSIRIEMKRRAAGETVEPWRADRAYLLLGDVHRRCVRWAQDHLDDLKQSDPAVPDQLHDRACDNWRCLLAIADAASGEWPERAREAAKTLSGGEEADTRRIMLLSDIRTIFADRTNNPDWIATAEIIRGSGRHDRAAVVRGRKPRQAHK